MRPTKRTTKKNGGQKSKTSEKEKMQTVKGEEKFICFLHMHVDQKTDQQVPFSRYILKKKGTRGLFPLGIWS